MFTAEFTGQLVTLPGLRFNPPLRIEKGKAYRLEIDRVTGKTEMIEEPSPSLKLANMLIQAPHPR